MFLTVLEVSKLLRVGKSTVRNLVEIGALKAVKLSERGTRISQASVDAYLKNLSRGEVDIVDAETLRAQPR